MASFNKKHIFAAVLALTLVSACATNRARPVTRVLASTVARSDIDALISNLQKSNSTLSYQCTNGTTSFQFGITLTQALNSYYFLFESIPAAPEKNASGTLIRDTLRWDEDLAAYIFRLGDMIPFKSGIQETYEVILRPNAAQDHIDYIKVYSLEEMNSGFECQGYDLTVQ